MTITIISDELQVFFLITSNNRTKHTHREQQQHKIHKINILHVNWTCVQCVHHSVAIRSPDDDAIYRRSCRTISVVSAMPRHSLVSVRHYWDETLAMFQIRAIREGRQSVLLWQVSRSLAKACCPTSEWDVAVTSGRYNRTARPLTRQKHSQARSVRTCSSLR